LRASVWSADASNETKERDARQIVCATRRDTGSGEHWWAETSAIDPAGIAHERTAHNDIGAHPLAITDSARDDSPRRLRDAAGERPQAWDWTGPSGWHPPWQEVPSMGKTYDVMLRTLYDREPADWLDYLRIAVPDPGQLRILDSNVSTIGAEVDKAVWVGGPEPFIVHTEFVSGRKRALPEVAFWYNR
jgi:hypothetical protein